MRHPFAERTRSVGVALCQNGTRSENVARLEGALRREKTCEFNAEILPRLTHPTNGDEIKRMKSAIFFRLPLICLIPVLGFLVA